MSKKITESKPRSIKTKFTKKMDPYFFDGKGKYKGKFNGKFIMDFEGFSFEGEGHMEGEEFEDEEEDFKEIPVETKKIMPVEEKKPVAPKKEEKKVEKKEVKKEAKEMPAEQSKKDKKKNKKNKKNGKK